MRCNNCGWDNQENASVCIKCNTQLEKPEVRKSQTENIQFNKTVFEQDAALPEKNEKVFEKTINENLDLDDDNADIEKDILISCLNEDCGYLNPGDALVCAKCKSPLVVEKGNKPPEKKYPQPGQNAITNNNKSFDAPAAINSEASNAPTIYSQPQPGNQSFKGTIDPYRSNNAKPNCTLKLILRDGEENLYPSEAVDKGFFSKEFVFDNNPVQLNRDNLDKNNATITGKIQAELSFENGEWYLRNRSELQTTFIQVKDKIELKEGDILLMGDRKFIFSTTNKSR